MPSICKNLFTVTNCNQAAVQAVIRPDLNPVVQMRLLSRTKGAERKSRMTEDARANTLYGAHEAVSVASFEAALLWPLMALVTESARYHQTSASRKTKKNLVVPRGKDGVPSKSPLAVGSVVFTQLVLEDVREIFNSLKLECATEMRRGAATTGARVTAVTPLTLANSTCRTQLAQLSLWRQ